MDNNESISSIKITDGYTSRHATPLTALNSATPNSARTIFSPSPICVTRHTHAYPLARQRRRAYAEEGAVTHVRDRLAQQRLARTRRTEEEQACVVKECDKLPFGTVRSPVKRSGRCIGQMIASMMHFFAYANPATTHTMTENGPISSHVTFFPL